MIALKKPDQIHVVKQGQKARVLDEIERASNANPNKAKAKAIGRAVIEGNARKAKW